MIEMTKPKIGPVRLYVYVNQSTIFIGEPQSKAQHKNNNTSSRSNKFGDNGKQ